MKGDHPFEGMFLKALRKSSPEENLVLEEAEGLRKKGYGVQEIYDALKHLHSTLIADEELAITGEALVEFSYYVDEE